MDFKELPVDGQAFEQLVRELVFSLGLHVEWSGRGPDGGRDLLCRETIHGQFAPQTRTWLIQCKHKAHSGDSVGIADLDDIVTSCIQHNATGYVLACSTQPSSATMSRLDGITSNPQNNITAVCWDGVVIQRLLSQPTQWAIAQRFMPISCGEWKIYATQSPNDFVVHYRGYVFHLTNRIGSKIGHHIPSISARISDIEAINLPKGHFIRPRSVWFDDKGGTYSWYIDYMRPHNASPAITRAEIKNILGDGWALDDGQVYFWDLKFVKYYPDSDHYDKDHYSYYTKYLPNYLGGTARDEVKSHEEYWATRQEIEDYKEREKYISQNSFKSMVESFNNVSYLKVVRAVNCNIEALSRFDNRSDWSDLTSYFDVDTDNIFTSTLILKIKDVKKFFTLLEQLPNDVNRHFRVSRVYVFLPNRGYCKESDEPLFDLHFRLHPSIITDIRTSRTLFNGYFTDIKRAVDNYRS